MPILKKITTAILIGFLSLSMSAHADDHAAPEGHEGGGEKEEHGEAPAAAAHGSEAPQSSLAPWVPVENKIQELHSKIKSKEANILKLLEEKNHLSNGSAHLKTNLAEVLKEHKELRALAEEYQKNVSILKYRFPERNAKSGRSYDRIEVKTIDEMEMAMGVDGKLNRNIKRMRSQFKSKESGHEVRREIANEAAPKPARKEKSIEEADTVILQK